MPHELVEHLSSEPSIPTDVASTIMWEMIGAGYIELSDDWHVSLVSARMNSGNSYARSPQS